MSDTFWSRFKLVKTGVGVALLSLGGWGMYVHYVQIRSLRATVLPAKMMLRAEIAGVLQHSIDYPGRLFEREREVGRIAAPRNDANEDVYLASLRQQLASVEAEVAALSTLSGQLHSMGKGFQASSTAFQKSRADYLRGRMAQLNSRVEAARARSTEAEGGVRRVRQLSAEGIASEQALQAAERDRVVAESEASSLAAELETLAVSLRFAQQGIHLDGNTADQPYAKQRLDEVNLTAASVTGRLTERQVRGAALKEELKAEQQRLERKRSVTLVVPARSRVWKILAAPGEYVRQGEDVLELRDCTRIQVLAWVSERNFNRLRIGSKASLRMADSGGKFEGQVVQMLGTEFAELGAGLDGLVQSTQTAVEERPFAVVVVSEALSRESHCESGKSADITFD